LPTPAHIIEQIRGGKADLEAEALIEYRNACQGAAKAGQYNDAVFSNHKTNMAIELMGGWVFLCNYEELGEYIGQKRFVDAYKAVSANPIQCSLPLCGTADSRNLYKFGRTPEEKAQCDKLLELHGSDRVTAVNALESIKIKQLESGV
jgi:hypothetical protein